MNEHIEFEDLVAFAWMDDLSEESIRLAARINGHLMNCTECMERLDSLKAVRRSADELKQRRAQRNEGKVIAFPGRMVRAAAEFRAADYEMPEIIAEGIIDDYDE